jgi:hypothetical protein
VRADVWAAESRACGSVRRSASATSALGAHSRVRAEARTRSSVPRAPCVSQRSNQALPSFCRGAARSQHSCFTDFLRDIVGPAVGPTWTNPRKLRRNLHRLTMRIGPTREPDLLAVVRRGLSSCPAQRRGRSCSVAGLSPVGSSPPCPIPSLIVGGPIPSLIVGGPIPSPTLPRGATPALALILPRGPSPSLTLPRGPSPARRQPPLVKRHR